MVTRQSSTGSAVALESPLSRTGTSGVFERSVPDAPIPLPEKHHPNGGLGRHPRAPVSGPLTAAPDPRVLLVGGSTSVRRTLGGTVRADAARWCEIDREILRLGRGLAAVIVEEPDYAQACVAIEAIRDLSETMPVLVVLRHHRWEDPRGPELAVHPLAPGDPRLLTLAFDQIDWLREAHARADGFACRYGLTSGQAEVVWRIALGIPQRHLHDACGVRVDHMNRRIYELRTHTGIRELHGIADVVLGRWRRFRDPSTIALSLP